MELTQLKYFIEAARVQNMSKAAQNLHISQPTLSRAITKLEAELGRELFQRRGKHIKLNEYGRIFAGQIQPAVEKIQVASGILADSESPEHRIDVGLWGSSHALTGCMARYRQKHPDIVLRVQCGIEKIERLDIIRYDMLLYPEHDEYCKKYRGIDLYEDKIMLAVHKNNPIADKIVIDTDRLCGESLVTLWDNNCQQGENLCRQRGARLKIAAVTDNTDMLRQLVSAGVGSCFVYESEAEPFLRDENIRLLHIGDEDFKRKIKICFKREKLMSAAAMEFKNFVMDYFKISREKIQ